MGVREGEGVVDIVCVVNTDTGLLLRSPFILFLIIRPFIVCLRHHIPRVNYIISTYLP